MSPRRENDFCSPRHHEAADSLRDLKVICEAVMELLVNCIYGFHYIFYIFPPAGFSGFSPAFDSVLTIQPGRRWLCHTAWIDSLSAPR